MEWPYKFPDPDDEIARQCAETQRYPFAERLDRRLELISRSEQELQNAPDRDARLAAKAASEREFQEAFQRTLWHAGIYGIAEPPADTYYVRYYLRPGRDRS